jgi:hypothetical protein
LQGHPGKLTGADNPGHCPRSRRRLVRVIHDGRIADRGPQTADREETPSPPAPSPNAGERGLYRRRTLSQPWERVVL